MMSQNYSPKERKLVVLFALLGTLFDGADSFVFTFFMGPLSKYFGISLVSVALIQTTSYLAGIIGGVLFGVFADRWGRRLGLSATVAVYSIFTLFSAFSHDYTTLMILRFIAGIGIGGEIGIAYAYLNEVYPMPDNSRGLYCGCLQTMFVFGGLIATAVYQASTALYGPEAWRWAFIWLCAVAILAAFIRTFMPESKLWLASKENLASQNLKSMPLADIFRGSLGRTTLWATILWTFLFYGSYSVIFFAPTVLNTVYKLSGNTVAHISYLGNAAAIVSYLICGWLMDKYSRRGGFYITAAFGTFAFLFYMVVGPVLQISVTDANVWSSLPLLGYLLMQMGYSYFGGQGAWLSELYPTHARTTGINFVYYVSRSVGGGLAPLGALYMVRALGFDARAAMALGAVGTILMLLTIRMVPETKGIELKDD